MVSLVDIANVKHKPVPIRGEDIDINGLTADHIAGVMFVFPEIRRIMSQDNPDREVITSLVARLPEAVAMIIAAGTGHSTEEEHIAAARTLGVGEQYALLEGILTATFPQGVKSFLDGVSALVNQSGAHGWAAAMKSPAQSNGASPPEGLKPTAGEAPQDSSAPGLNS